MAQKLKDPKLAVAVADVEVALVDLSRVGFGGVSAGVDAAAAVQRVEAVNARIHALLLDVQSEVDERGLYAADGHASAKVLVRHASRLSSPEASRRAKAVRALRDLPGLRVAHREGRVGIEQVHRVARVWGNPRVRDLAVAHDELFVELAETLSYPDFDAVLTDWERLADQDGAGDRARKAHEQRSASVIGDFDGSFHLRASCGGLQGAEMREIHRHYVEAEFKADWAEARERLGDAATVNDLARTDAQRHMDALHRIFTDAAAAQVSTPAGSTIETGVVVDGTTFEREAARFAGHDPGPDPRAESHLVGAVQASRVASAGRAGCADQVAPPRPKSPDGGRTDPDGDGDRRPAQRCAPEAATGSEGTPGPAPVGSNDVRPVPSPVPGTEFRCETIDGTPLDPTEVVAQALIGHVRRVVLGANSVVIDLGRRSRLFTGPAALAARLGNRTCYWPGCVVPASQCQIDHLQPWSSSERPRTNPGNGGPACGKHNRYKENGYTVWRDPAGSWHTYRPDGSEI